MSKTKLKTTGKMIDRYDLEKSMMLRSSTNGSKFYYPTRLVAIAHENH